MQQLSGSGVSYAAAAFAAAAVSSQEEVLEDLASAEDGSSFKVGSVLKSAQLSPFSPHFCPTVCGCASCKHPIICSTGAQG